MHESGRNDLLDMNFGYPNIEAVRIKVKKCDGEQEPEYRKFSVDPQITSLAILRCLLTRAFDIRGEFTISYMAVDDIGEETFLALLSDWDLDAAFISACDACLLLRLEMRAGGGEVISSVTDDPLTDGRLDLTQLRKPSATALTSGGGPRTLGLGGVINQMQNTFSLMSRALSAAGDDRVSATSAVGAAAAILAPPLSDGQFHNYLDTVGRLVQPKELRVAIYRGGVEPTLRKVVWKHLLNVYPDGMTGRERIDYIREKSAEYRSLLTSWTHAVQHGKVISEIQQCTNMVRKDVLRTDRQLPFYAGQDDNANLVSLFNILTTYALHHPSVGYVQGMSDLASPLLFVMRDESQAYICFCGLMRRLQPNFTMDGIAMTAKFQHLSDTLQFYDPELFAYFKERQADDLLFCYRWLLLELKREFAFGDALRMLEVLWSSQQPQSPCSLPLFERSFHPAPSATLTAPHVVEGPAAGLSSPVSLSSSPPGVAVPAQPTSLCLSTRRTTAYSRVCAMRRRSSGALLAARRELGIAGAAAAAHGQPARSFSEDDQRRVRRERLLRDKRQQQSQRCQVSGEMSPNSVVVRDLAEFGRLTSPTGGAPSPTGGEPSAGADDDPPGDDPARVGYSSEAATPPGGRATLPSPQQLGGGNPFLIFLCLSLLRQQRRAILSRRLDYPEIAVLFDRLVRRQDVVATLRQARSMFSEYLKRGWSANAGEGALQRRRVSSTDNNSHSSSNSLPVNSNSSSQPPSTPATTNGTVLGV